MPEARKLWLLSAEASGDAGGFGAAIDHFPSIAIGHWHVAKGFAVAIDGRKQRFFGKSV